VKLVRKSICVHLRSREKWKAKISCIFVVSFPMLFYFQKEKNVTQKKYMACMNIERMYQRLRSFVLMIFFRSQVNTNAFTYDLHTLNMRWDCCLQLEVSAVTHLRYFNWNFFLMKHTKAFSIEKIRDIFSFQSNIYKTLHYYFKNNFPKL